MLDKNLIHDYSPFLIFSFYMKSERVVMSYIYASGFSHEKSRSNLLLISLIILGLERQDQSIRFYVSYPTDLMFISDVDGDGLLSYFYRGVHVLWFQSLPFLSGLLCCFTNNVSISLTRQFILLFE